MALSRFTFFSLFINSTDSVTQLYQMVEKKISVLLGSSSRFRRALFSRVIALANEESKGKFVFEQVFADDLVPDIDEKGIRRPGHADLTKAITWAKTNKLLELLDERPELKAKVDIIVAGDQVIGFNGEIREKPESEEEAKETLQSYGLSGHPAEAFSCIEVTNIKTGVRRIEVGLAKAFFKQVPDSVAAGLIKKGDIMHAAGSFVIEDDLLQPYVDKIEGEIETIQGMPKTVVKNLLLLCAE